MIRQERRPRRAAIGVESLEGRTVLSTVSTALIAHLKGSMSTGITYLDLQGTAHGKLTKVVGNPDVGSTVSLKGSGNVPGLGAVNVSGSLHGTGFIASGHVEGSVTLTTNKGSVTLQLTSPSVGGFTAPASGTYNFTIQNATGSLAHDFGNGTVAVSLGSSTFKLTFNGKPNVY